jgi:hypothetical protein
MEYKKHERQKDGDNVQANDEANAISPVPSAVLPPYRTDDAPFLQFPSPTSRFPLLPAICEEKVVTRTAECI